MKIESMVSWNFELLQPIIEQNPRNFEKRDDTSD